MKMIKNLTFAALAALAVALLFQTSITRADDEGNGHGKKGDRDAKVTFTKCVTGKDMLGGVGGDVGDGAFTGKILGVNVMDPVTGITKIEALYHFEGSEHVFTALVHIEQIGLNAAITGVVTEGWLKGHAVEGEFTKITAPGVVPACFAGALEIEGDSKD